MKTSENITQLVDIPATVFDLIGIEAPPTDGISVFKLDEVPDREISIYSGVYDRNAEGRTQVLGRDFKESTIAHLRYGPGNRWRIEPDLPATHEGW